MDLNPSESTLVEGPGRRGILCLQQEEAVQNVELEEKELVGTLAEVEKFVDSFLEDLLSDASSKLGTRDYGLMKGITSTMPQPKVESSVYFISPRTTAKSPLASTSLLGKHLWQSHLVNDSFSFPDDSPDLSPVRNASPIEIVDKQPEQINVGKVLNVSNQLKAHIANARSELDIRDGPSVKFLNDDSSRLGSGIAIVSTGSHADFDDNSGDGSNPTIEDHAVDKAAKVAKRNPTQQKQQNVAESSGLPLDKKGKKISCQCREWNNKEHSKRHKLDAFGTHTVPLKSKETGETVGYVRRSTRIKSRPLEYWKGERFLYGRIYDSLSTVIGIKYEAQDDGGANKIMKVKSFVSDEYKDLVEKAARL